MGLDVIDIKPRIGSEIKVDPEALIKGDFAAELRRLLIQRGVLVFRDLDITTDQQRAITASLGRLQQSAGEGLQKVTLDPEVSPEYSAFFPTTFFWHLDGHFKQTMPVFAGSLRPAILPAEGGDTEFLNACAAYEDLPEEEQSFLDTLQVVHSQDAALAAASPEAIEKRSAALSVPRAVQPLIWEHRSGRKSLMLGGSVSHVQGMHPADSFDLLIRLRAHMSQPAYVYSHAWRMNDLVLWDNTGTLHRARPFDPSADRLLNRFSLEGEEPIRAPTLE
jgi:alpha-ketoglutarate-dependent taurine dioxygenase